MPRQHHRSRENSLAQFDNLSHHPEHDKPTSSPSFFKQNKTKPATPTIGLPKNPIISLSKLLRYHPPQPSKVQPEQIPKCQIYPNPRKSTSASRKPSTTIPYSFQPPDMSGVRTRRQATADSTPATPSTPSPAPNVARMNGNGSTHAAKEVSPRENIFLFYPNLIGLSLPPLCAPSNRPQDISELFSHLRRYITCLSTPKPAQDYTAFPAFSMRSMVMLRDIMSSPQSSARFSIW